MNEKEYFIKHWNNDDVIISSVDIRGCYNQKVEVRRDIKDLDEIALITRDGSRFSGRVLLQLFLDGDLKVFQEVPYI